MQYQDLNNWPKMCNIKGMFTQISVTLHGVQTWTVCQIPKKILQNLPGG